MVAERSGVLHGNGSTNGSTDPLVDPCRMTANLGLFLSLTRNPHSQRRNSRPEWSAQERGREKLGCNPSKDSNPAGDAIEFEGQRGRNA